MELKYPIEYDIRAKQLEDGKWELTYIEKFQPQDFEVLEQASKMFKKLLPDIDVNVWEDRIILNLEGSRDRIMNIIAGEFLMTSSLGRTRLNELFAIVLARSQEE